MPPARSAHMRCFVSRRTYQPAGVSVDVSQDWKSSCEYESCVFMAAFTPLKYNKKRAHGELDALARFQQWCVKTCFLARFYSTAYGSFPRAPKTRRFRGCKWLKHCPKIAKNGYGKDSLNWKIYISSKINNQCFQSKNPVELNKNIEQSTPTPAHVHTKKRIRVDMPVNVYFLFKLTHATIRNSLPNPN